MINENIETIENYDNPSEEEEYVSEEEENDYYMEIIWQMCIPA